VLEDPKRAIPPYDAVLLVSPKAAKNPRLMKALRPLVGAISADHMRRANYQVDRSEDKRTVDQAAAWLRQASGLAVEP